MIFNDTITIFNRYEDGDYNDGYKKTVLKNVCAQNYISGEDNVKDSATKSKCKIFIHKEKIDKTFVEPKKWLGLQVRDNKFTLSRSDYLVIGEVNEEITDISSLYDKYDYVYKIESFIYFDILKSLQVVAL